jgi:hypothetical protein
MPLYILTEVPTQLMLCDCRADGGGAGGGAFPRGGAVAARGGAGGAHPHHRLLRGLRDGVLQHAGCAALLKAYSGWLLHLLTRGLASSSTDEIVCVCCVVMKLLQPFAPLHQADY